MKRFISVLLVICTLAVTLSACSGGKKIDKLSEAMLSKQSSTIKMVTVKSGDPDAKEAYNKAIDTFGIDNVDSFFISLAENTRENADEILVLQLKSKKELDLALAAVSKHFGYNSASYMRTKPSEVPKFNNKSLFTYKNYVVLIVSENSAEIEQAFYNAVK